MENHAAAPNIGEEALAAGDWPSARTFFETTLTETDDPEAHLGLGRALWWMQDIDGALFHVEAAYAAFRSRGDRREAAAAALWLSREYAAAHGNEPASSGWEARAEGLLRDEGPCIEQGWLALTRAERATTPNGSRSPRARLSTSPVHTAMRTSKRSRSRGSATPRWPQGTSLPGTTKLDEAMAAVTGGEVDRLETIGDVTCTAIAAFELAADWQRIERWGQVIEAWVRQHNSAPVIGFCNACCAELFLSSGQWEMAEGLLTEGLDVLRSSDQRARCVHPAAKLAELRLLQGRIEEAEQLLAGYEELPEAAHALASLYLARGETSVATAVIRRRLNRTGGDSVLAAPFLALLVDVQLTEGDMAGADASAERLRGIGERSALPRVQAAAAFAAGKVAEARGDDDASDRLAEAVAAFSDQGMTLDAAMARMRLAGSLEDGGPRRGHRRRAGRAHGVRTSRGSSPRGCGGRVPARARLLGTDGSQGTGSAHTPGDGSARPVGARTHERRDRRTPVHQHEDRRAPREQHPREAASEEPLRGRRLRAAGRRRDPDPKIGNPPDPSSRVSHQDSPHQTKEVRCVAQQTSRSGKNALKREISISVEHRTTASPEAVYDVLSDLRTHAVWGGVPPTKKSGLLSIEAPSGEATVGTEWNSTGGDPMGRFTDRSVVTQAVRPSVFEFVTEARLTTKKDATADWTNVHRYELRPDGDGCVIAYTVRIARISALPGMLRMFNLPVLSGMAVKESTKVVRRGVEKLAAFVEQRADAR